MKLGLTAENPGEVEPHPRENFGWGFSLWKVDLERGSLFANAGLNLPHARCPSSWPLWAVVGSVRVERFSCNSLTSRWIAPLRRTEAPRDSRGDSGAARRCLARQRTEPPGQRAPLPSLSLICAIAVLAGTLPEGHQEQPAVDLGT